MVRLDSLTKGTVHIIVDLPPGFGGQVVRCWVIFQIKLRPDNKVNDSLVHTIWPIIVEDLDIGGFTEGDGGARREVLPLQSLFQHEVDDRSILFLQLGIVFNVPAEV